jgi:TonB family protein
MLQFYGLREHPFGVSPNPRYLYPSVQHREALASLNFGIDNQVGFAALIAEPGTGKTTLLFDVLKRYRDVTSTAFVFNTQCSGEELLRHILMELQIPGGESERDPVMQHQLFTNYVADRHRTKPVLIVIDEAQHLDDTAMEALRLLSNFEASDHKLLHIVLAGQPQLADKLRREAYTQLLQRITIISRLGRFSAEQTDECIAFRLQVAGYTGGPLFSGEAMAKIVEASGGVPREINRICLNSLYLGFALRQKQIGVDVIEEVLSDLDLSCTPKPFASAALPKGVSKYAAISEGSSESAAHAAAHAAAQYAAAQEAAQSAAEFAAQFAVQFAAQFAAKEATQSAAQSAVQAAAQSAVQAVRQEAPGARVASAMPNAMNARVAPRTPVAPPVPKAFSTPPRARILDNATRVVSGERKEVVASTVPDVPVVTRIVDEWETHTPIDPAMGMSFRRDEPTATPPQVKAVKTAKVVTRLEAAPARVLNRVKLKVSGGTRTAIMVSLCSAVAIALMLIGLNSSYVQQQIVSASWPAQPVPITQSAVKPAAQPAAPDNAASVSNETVKIAADNRQAAPRSGRQGGYQEAVLEVFVRPVYPTEAQKMHVQGDVAMKLKVGEDGAVHGIKVLSGEPVLAKAAMEAAQQWRYRPALQDGAPVSAETKTVLTFRVSDNKN